jgi:eukaryotic-like serine/threonine-protein kinase
MAEIPDKIGKYVIDSILGKGGMGEVYKAHDSSLGRYVALKIMRGPSLDDTYARERFIREAQAAGGLRHPNIVTIYDLGNVEDQLYIAMEFIHGQDLDKLIRVKAPLSIDEKINVMVQVCEGISYAHKHQIVHRDLKPSNIRIDEEGIVKIMDFGIAHLESSNMTASGMVLGTPYYMSPEQVRGLRVDARSDLFALGAILYEVFAYEKPFTGEMTAVFYKIAHEQPAPLSEFLNIPAEPLQRVIDRCLEKDKNARVQSAQEVSQMLREAQTAYRELNVATLDGVETVNLSPEMISLKLTSVPAAVDTARRSRTPTSGGTSKAAPSASPTQLIQPTTTPPPAVEQTAQGRISTSATPLAQTE